MWVDLKRLSPIWWHFVKWCRIMVCFVWCIKNNAWVIVNNEFWVRIEAICQSFSRVTKSREKIFGKSFHEDPKIVIHGNECIISFLTRYFMCWTHTSAKNNYRSLISPKEERDKTLKHFSMFFLWRILGIERFGFKCAWFSCLFAMHSVIIRGALYTCGQT